MAGIRLSPGAVVIFFGAVDPRARPSSSPPPGPPTPCPAPSPARSRSRRTPSTPAKGRGTAAFAHTGSCVGRTPSSSRGSRATPARASGANGVALDLPEATGGATGPARPTRPSSQASVPRCADAGGVRRVTNRYRRGRGTVALRVNALRWSRFPHRRGRQPVSARPGNGGGLWPSTQSAASRR